MRSQGAGESEWHPGDASVWRLLTDACELGEGRRYTLMLIGAVHLFDFPSFCDVLCRSLMYLREWRGSEETNV